jgi:hypothetical protein
MPAPAARLAASRFTCVPTRAARGASPRADISIGIVMNKMYVAALSLLISALVTSRPSPLAAQSPATLSAGADNTPPAGFTALFNGKDLTGWKGLPKAPNDNPAKRAALSSDERAKVQAAADQRMRDHWSVKDGALVFDGKGDSLCTLRDDYGDVELLVDWKILPQGDSGIYLRGTPQIQIWDPAAPSAKGVGSGGLFNNEKNPKDPSAKADKPVGEWNTFHIKMVGEKVWVKLNGQTVVDGVVLENYWDRSQPIFPTGQIELQNHGNTLYFKNVYVKELPRQ